MDLTPAAAGANSGEGSLKGLRLRAIQALWVILVPCDLIVLIVSLPAFYRALHSICSTPSPGCQADQLIPQGQAVLQHTGFSLHAYLIPLCATVPLERSAPLQLVPGEDTYVKVVLSTS